MFLAKNPELDRLHEAASIRLEQLKLRKETLAGIRRTGMPKKSQIRKREKVEVTLEEEQEAPSKTHLTELVAEEN